MSKLIGTGPNQVPTNGDLGTLAYQNNDNVTLVDPLFQHDDSRQAKFKRVSGSWSTIEITAGNTTGNSRIAFTDPDTEDQIAQNTASGMIDYEHSGDGMRFYVQQDQVMVLYSGEVTLPNVDKNTVGFRMESYLATANGSLYGDHQELRFEGTSTNGTLPAGIRQYANHWHNSDTALAFWTQEHGGSYDERMRILGNGNIGVKTSTPIYAMDVRGTGYYSDQLRLGAQRGLYTYSDSGTKYYTHLCTFSGYQSSGALILTTNIPGHNISGNGNMFAIRLVGYNYSARYNTDLWIGCYAGEGNFYSTTVNGTCPYDWEDNIYVYTDSNGKVAFQLGGFNGAIHGEFAIAEFVQGFSNTNTSYATGWSMAAVTTAPTQNNKTALSGYEYHPVHMHVEDTVTVGTNTSGKWGTLNIYDSGNNYHEFKGDASNTLTLRMLGTSAMGNVNFAEHHVNFNGSITLGNDGEHQISKQTVSPISGATTDTTLVRGRQVDIYAYDDIHLRAGTGDTIQFTYGGTTRVKMFSDGQVYCPSGSGGSIMGDYSYTQVNDGDTSSWQNILGPNGNAFNTDVTNNRYAEVIIVTLGTGTNNMWCHYRYHNNSDTNSATLTHISGNSGSSSNRPYMQLSGQNMQWNMAHTGSYTVLIKVMTAGSLLT